MYDGRDWEVGSGCGRRLVVLVLSEDICVKLCASELILVIFIIYVICYKYKIRC